MAGSFDIAPVAFEVETERLQLRLLDGGDEALFRDLYTDSVTMRFIGPPVSATQAVRNFRKTVAGMNQQPIKWLYLVMLEKRSLQPLGVCGTPQLDEGATRLELGIVLNAGAHSRGFAREGVKVVMSRIFALLPVNELWAKCSVENSAAERVVVSLGFAPCDDAINESGPLSKRIWSIHRSSWCIAKPSE